MTGQETCFIEVIYYKVVEVLTSTLHLSCLDVAWNSHKTDIESVEKRIQKVKIRDSVVHERNNLRMEVDGLGRLMCVLFRLYGSLHV